MLNKKTVMLLLGTALAGAAFSLRPAAAASPLGARSAARFLDAEKNGKEEEKEVEEKVAIDKLPAAVVETVNKECAGGKITEADKVTKHGKQFYEIDVTVGDIKFEVKTTLDGTFRSKEVDDEKDETDDHADKK